MTNSPRAGQPALPTELVDVDALIAAYYDVKPDPSDPAQRVAFGTSGHRGSAFRAAFNEPHILATTEAICRYRTAQGYTGPLFIGRDTHALSEPAWRTALEVLVANGVDVRVDAARRLHPDAGGVARDPRREPRTIGEPTASRTASSSRRRTTRPTTAASSTTRPTADPADTDVTRWIQDEANRILEATGSDGLDGIARVPFERAPRDRRRPRLHGRLRRRPRQRRRHGGDRVVGPADRRGPAGWRGGRLLGRDRGAVRARPDRSPTRRSTRGSGS